MRRRPFLICSLVLVAPVWVCAVSPLLAKDPVPSHPVAPRLFNQSAVVKPIDTPEPKAADSTPSKTGTGSASEDVSDIRRMSLIEEGLKSDTERLTELQNDLKSREEEFEEARKDVAELTTECEAGKKQLTTLTGAAARQLAEQIAALEKRIELARKRFDLAIEERRKVQALIATLEQQLEQNNRALEDLKGDPDSAAEKSEKKLEQSAEPQARKTAAAEHPPESAVPPASKQLEEAREEVQDKETEVKLADQETARTVERRRTLQKSVELEKDLLRTARQRGDNLELTIQNLEQDFGQRLAAGVAHSELAALRKDIQEAQHDLHDVRAEVRRRSDRMESLNAQLAAVQTEELQLAHEAEDKRRTADAAHRKEAFVQFEQHVIERAPKFLLVLAFMFVLWRLEILVGRRLAGLIAHSSRGTEGERQNRANTLVGVFDNAVSVVIVLGGGLTLLDVIGVPIVPLMGGAAVVGLAAAFGAQNLIRDYFYGFIILLENQYKLNDAITINDMSGVVERITLRITVLRDFEGRVYYIPNGQITSVINATQGWSRAVLDITIGYSEDVDTAMALLTSLAVDMQKEPEYESAIIDGPEMLGLEHLGENGVLIKLSLKTQPDKKMLVKRELQRRIKNRFDEQGIELAAARRTIYVRNEDLPHVSSKAA